jgi:hypothetical protein
VVGNVRRKGAHFYRVFADDTREQTIMGRRRWRRWSEVRHSLVAASSGPGTAAHQQEQEGEQANQGAQGHGLARGEFHEESDEVIDDGPLHGILPSARCQCWRRILLPRRYPGINQGARYSSVSPSYLITSGISTSTNAAALPLQFLDKIIDSGSRSGIMKAGTDACPRHGQSEPWRTNDVCRDL